MFNTVKWLNISKIKEFLNFGAELRQKQLVVAVSSKYSMNLVIKLPCSVYHVVLRWQSMKI